MENKGKGNAARCNLIRYKMLRGRGYASKTERLSAPVQQYLCTVLHRGLATSRYYEYGKKAEAVQSIAQGKPHFVKAGEVYSLQNKPVLLGTIEGCGDYADAALQPRKSRKRKELRLTNNAAVPLPARKGEWFGFVFLDEEKPYWAQLSGERVERHNRDAVRSNMEQWTSRYNAVWIDDQLFYPDGSIAGEIRVIPESGHVA